MSATAGAPGAAAASSVGAVPLGLRVGAAGVVAGGALWSHLPVHPPGACPLRATTGIPCALCGMTRSVVAAVEGDFGASLGYHPAGIVVLVLALAVLAARRLPRVRVSGWTVGALLAGLWIYNVAFNPTF